jgi:hypothetical protein
MRFRFKENRLKKPVIINKLIPAIMRELGLDNEFLMEEIRSLWADAAGSVLSTHSMPDRIFHGFLYVSVDHPVYSNEIILMKEGIKGKIGEKIGDGIVRDIRTEVRKLDRRNKKGSM